MTLIHNPMKTIIKLVPPKWGPKVKEYKDRFGHSPSAEALKFQTAEELEAMASAALDNNVPIEDWETRPDRKTGTVTDGWYKKDS